jgi:ubiquinol-cytochrome c reductase cytochrome c subunit
MKKTLLAAALMVGGACAFAQDAPSGSAERGHQAFEKYQCFRCHGTVGQGGGIAGPKLAPNPFPWAAFQMQVRTPRADMPPFRSQFLSDQDLADIYAYIRSVKGGTPAKDIPLLTGN